MWLNHRILYFRNGCLTYTTTKNLSDRTKRKLKVYIDFQSEGAAMKVQLKAKMINRFSLCCAFKSALTVN